MTPGWLSLHARSASRTDFFRKAPHTAETEAGTPGDFDTERLDTGEKKGVRLDRPGKLAYFCVYHRFMTGTVEVVE
jgi:plastocyanin